MLPPTIPIFPLPNAVLVPSVFMPLHIFEERYRAMTRRCLDSGEPFGVVLIRDGREIGTARMATLAGVGAFAEIRQAGRYPDGRYDLLAAATGRYAIESGRSRGPSQRSTADANANGTNQRTIRPRNTSLMRSGRPAIAAIAAASA